MTYRCRIPSALVTSPALSDSEWELLVVVLRFCYGRNYCERSVYWLADWLGRKRDTVIAQARTLEQAGWVHRLRVGNDTLWILNRAMVRTGEPEPGWVPPPALAEAVQGHHQARKAWHKQRRVLSVGAEHARKAEESLRAGPARATKRRLATAKERLREAEDALHQHCNPESKQRALAIPDSLRYPRLDKGAFITVPRRVLTKQFMKDCGGARLSAGIRRLLLYLYVIAEGRAECFVTIAAMATGLRHDPEAIGDWLKTLVEMGKIKREYVSGDKKKTRLSYEQIGGKLKAHTHYEASNKRRVQGVVIGLPGNRRRSLVDDELKRKFAGVVRSDHPRRKAGGIIAGGI